MIGMVNGSAATKFTVHYNLFGKDYLIFRWVYYCSAHIKAQTYLLKDR